MQEEEGKEMTHVAIVKKSDLLRGNIVRVLGEKIPACHVEVFDETAFRSLYQRDNKGLDLLIIDIDTIPNDMWHLVDHYLKRDTKVAIWLNDIQEDMLKKLFKLDLAGYLYYKMESNELIYSIRCILEGSQFIDPRIAPILLASYREATTVKPRRPEGMLTKREWEVLELIVQGKKNDVISERLFISYKTVTNHVASIFRKLKVSDRTSAAHLAIKNKWVVL